MADLPDYPAAHSMDTDWYAVDAEGHVAAFNSESNGAVPESYPPLSDLPYDEFLLQLGPDLESGKIPLQPEELFAVSPIPVDEIPSHPPSELLKLEKATASATIYLLPADFPPERLRPRPAFLVPIAAGKLACYEGDLEYDCYLDLVRSGQLLRVWRNTSERDDHWGRTSLFVPSSVGLFEYDHARFEGLAGPYDRVAIPSRPLKLAELPAGLQTAASFVVFTELTFAASPTLQPFEHFPRCRSWGWQWLASDEKTVTEIPDEDQTDG